MRCHVDLLRPHWTDPPEVVGLDTAPPDLEAPVPVQPTVVEPVSGFQRYHPNYYYWN